MGSVPGIHFAAFTVEYKAILAQAEEVVTGLPPLLRQQAEAIVPQLLQGDFCRLVAVLPYWVADVLDEPHHIEKDGATPLAVRLAQGPDRSSENTQTLALSQLLGCWSYLLQDAVLDRHREQPSLIPLAVAFHAMAIRLLQRLLPGNEPFWDALEELTLRTGEAQCWELSQQRLADFSDLGRVSPIPNSFFFTATQSGPLDRLADRSALLQVAVAAQLVLRGHPPDHSRGVALRRMLRHYAMARQIGDDLGDWSDDLKRGQVNMVAGYIAHRMKEVGVVRSYADLDVDRMAAYLLYDDHLFAELHQAAMDACERAAAELSAHRPSHLMALVNELEERLRSSYEAAQARRASLRLLFAPLCRAEWAKP